MVSKVRYILLLMLVVLAFSSCKKNDWLDWKTENELWLKANLQKPFVYNDSVYTIRETASGLQYVVIADPNPTEAKPGPNSYITAEYEGRLINGARFDKNVLHQYVYQLVEGFQEGIKKIHTHGTVVMFIPSELGYGKEGSGSEGGGSFVPPYSTLIFEVTLNAIE